LPTAARSCVQPLGGFGVSAQVAPPYSARW
jgi:hypothetical protein